MTVTIDGVAIPLRPQEVKSAMRAALEFIDQADKICAKRQQPTYFFTLLAVLNLLSQELLSAVDPHDLAAIMEAFQSAMSENESAES